MAETSSSMLPLGTLAPNFELMDVQTEQLVSLTDTKSPAATVIMFICNHCPYVKHIKQKLLEIVKNYQKKGIRFIAISSNDVDKYPEDGPKSMREEALKNAYTFPYLFDETQEVAKAYKAACTPDFYAFDQALKCVYRGRFDNSTPGNNNPVTGKDLTQALDLLLAKKAISQEQYPSLGCNIKWKNNA